MQTAEVESGDESAYEALRKEPKARLLLGGLVGTCVADGRGMVVMSTLPVFAVLITAGLGTEQIKYIAETAEFVCDELATSSAASDSILMTAGLQFDETEPPDPEAVVGLLNALREVVAASTVSLFDALAVMPLVAIMVIRLFAGGDRYFESTLANDYARATTRIAADRLASATPAGHA